MRSLTKLGLVLSIVFLVSFLALAAELVYLLWYRRRSRRVGSDRDFPVEAEEDPFSASRTSKQLLLLYVLCWRNQSRVEPTSAAAVKPPPPPQPAPPPAEDVEAELEKLTMIYQSRALFTINEGEKEGMESDSGSARAEQPQRITPFATPCGTPPFFTPPASPPRESSPKPSRFAADEDDNGRRRPLAGGG